MFGEKIDSKLLDFITHDRNLKHEMDIKQAAHILSTNYEPSSEDFDKFISRTSGNFDWKGKKILDVACGKGDFIHFLSKNGALKAVGIDIQSEEIKVAKSYAKREKINNSEFIDGDFFNWNTDEKFDYIVSNEALDHILDLERTLSKMKSLLKDDGTIINICSDFWKGPVSDHCSGFMKFLIPWRHLIFNQNAIFKMRKKKYRPDDPGLDFSSIRGGLSQYTLSDYESCINKLDFSVLEHSINFQIKSLTRYSLVNKTLFLINNVMVKTPFVGEYFASSLISVLKKRQ